jgi:hypothetical protein
MLLATVIIGIILIPVFTAAWIVVESAAKHQPHTNSDAVSRLTGRWFRYGLAALLVLFSLSVICFVDYLGYLSER